MPNYIVRVIDGGEAVGIFAVADLDDLIYWVDEVTDPALCEYAPIGPGSIIWPGRALSIPVSGMDWEADQRPLLAMIGNYDVGGTWIGALVNSDLVFDPLLESPEPSANDN